MKFLGKSLNSDWSITGKTWFFDFQNICFWSIGASTFLAHPIGKDWRCWRGVALQVGPWWFRVYFKISETFAFSERGWAKRY